ncbi:MAG: Gfo/Idh/MocA family oxidoreductase [Anaerolineae bacterium]|nr:Gfo/Idh/MocA family oxidoreductase [Anaerolineae bacterium]
MLRIGLIGAGYAAHHHARSFQRLSAMGLAQLGAVFSRDLQRAESLARRYGAQLCPDLEAFWETNPDAVDICTPTPTHAEYALEAIRRGKHVLVEKPIARTLQEATAMVRAAQQSGVILMVAHEQRFEPDCRRAWEIVRAGGLGRLRMARQVIVGPYPEWSTDDWFADFDQSGGPLLDLAIHSLDYFNWLFGGPPLRVYAIGVRRRLTFEDHTVALLRYPDGGLAWVEASWGMPRGSPLIVRTELIGTAGVLQWDSQGTASFQIWKEGGESQAWTPIDVDGFAAEIQHFVECIRQGTAPEIRGEEAIAALRTALAAIASLQARRPVMLEEVSE